ncbi:tyrosine-protein phosphatase [Nesterenkonia ebinurensis]|uniref:tyrosine-protein phosphatase n=1 Tax=Nesterenkonia ebinurensis TaxID=2608252 RepID=UPI00123D1B83|nr:tyrosine-protein phosphatase [Nesterenkonia ebinurensis]
MTYETTTASSDAMPLVNLRDLGGIPVEGGRVKPGVLWRSDDPTIAPREEISALAQQGLSAVLDLRSTPEVVSSPHRLTGELGVRAHHLPLAETAVHPLAIVEAAPAMRSPVDVGRWYAGLVRSHIHEVAEGLQVIGQAEGGVLFHCAAGKDRTGILAGVALTLLGADRSEIVADYARTQKNLTKIFERLRYAAYAQPKHPDDEGAARARAFFSSNHPLLTAAEDSMDSMLSELGGSGGILDLLKRETDPDELAEELNAKLVE